jgi:glycosyltransferase involved in cell wall biosynthesis
METTGRPKIRILYGIEAAEGGALKHVVYLALHLDRRLFDITVMLSTRRTDKVYAEMDKLRAAGVTVIELDMERTITPKKDLAALLSLYAHLGRHAYDVVHAHSSKAGVLFRVAAWLRRVPAVLYTPHCFYFQGRSGIVRAGYATIEKLMALVTDALVVSTNEKNSALQYRVATPRKLVNINNAIDFREYRFGEKHAVRRELGIAEGVVVVGAIGRLVEQKGWLTYIYAAREIVRDFPDVVFLIAGDGALRAELTHTIRALGLAGKVFITPHCDEIGRIYSAIDIFVSPSLWEGLPYVLLEAMWFKKPIVATDLGYGNLIVDQENGYLVAAEDYLLMAARIEQLLRNQALINRMGESGYSRVNAHFSFPAFVRAHEKLYQRMLRGHGAEMQASPH